MAAILTITMNPALDLTALTTHVIPTVKLRCNEPQTQAGGGGINVAKVAARFGADALAVFPVGGPAGDRLRALLADEPITLETVPIAGDTRQNLTVNDGASAEQYRFVFPGPTITEEEEAAILRKIATPPMVPAAIVLSGSFAGGVRRSFVAALRREATALGAALIVDGPAEVLRHCRGALLIKPNQRELELLTGRGLQTTRQQADAARQLIAEDVAQNVLISLGEDGAVLVGADKMTRYTVPQVELVSAVGAGDSMVGAMVASLADGAPLEEAVADGVAAGTAAILTPGTDLSWPQDAKRVRGEVGFETVTG